MEDKITKTFEELGLGSEMINTLNKLKIKTPSEIQEKTIPLILSNKDVIGGSATGSGKTLAFASSIIQNLEKNKNVQALILTPTRELAEQVANSIKEFSKHKKLKTLPIYGGVSIDNQIRNLQDTDVVVGTPGRIIDHLNRGTLNLKKVKFLVLDEVDRMFDMGFQFDVEKILKQCPENRQTMLFSATISVEMDHLANKYTKNPIEVSVKSHVDPLKLKQIYYDVPDGLKFSLFVHLLKKEESKLIMVFCSTRRNVDFVADNLNNLGIASKAIHGGMVQNKRSKVMSEFNSKKGVNVLVCTDVAARGLDIEEVSHVYNYDLPKTSDEYIHRIGRTARAGKQGIAISILCSRDYENFGNILDNKKLKIEKKELPKFEKVRIITNNKKSFTGNKRFSRNQRDFSKPRNSSRGYSGDNRDSKGRFSRDDKKPRRYGDNKDFRNNKDNRYSKNNNTTRYGDNKKFKPRNDKDNRSSGNKSSQKNKPKKNFKKRY